MWSSTWSMRWDDVSERFVEERVIAVISYRRRKKPAYHYQSPALRYYRPYIAYYEAVPNPETLSIYVKHLRTSLEKRKNDEVYMRKELVMFPVRGVDAVVDYAKSLEAEIHYLDQMLRKIGSVEKTPAMIFPDRYKAMKHLIFSITYATVRSVSKVEKIREVVNGLNVNILEPFYNTATHRYRDLRDTKDPGWLWKVLRIGMAFKVMYMIDRA